MHAGRATRICLIATILLTSGLLACDPEGRRKCDWVLEAEPKLKGQADEGMIPVCARNRVTMKEDCRLQTNLDFAKNAMGRRFRYDDLVVENPGIPRTIKSIKYCERR